MPKGKLPSQDRGQWDWVNFYCSISKPTCCLSLAQKDRQRGMVKASISSPSEGCPVTTGVVFLTELPGDGTEWQPDSLEGLSKMGDDNLRYWGAKCEFWQHSSLSFPRAVCLCFWGCCIQEDYSLHFPLSVCLHLCGEETEWCCFHEIPVCFKQRLEDLAGRSEEYIHGRINKN